MTAADIDARSPLPTLPNEVKVPTPIFSSLSGSERLALRLAVAATLDTVADPIFARELSHLSDFRAGPDSTEPLSGQHVASEFLGSDLNTHQLPTSYRSPQFLFWTKPCWGETADTGVSGNKATTKIRACTFDRANRSAGRDDVARFACAINTIAHEWTHAIPITAGEDTQKYVDNGHNAAAPTTRLVSYTVGSLAQCVYLNAHGYVVSNFIECVTRAGTAVFNQSSCSDEGARGLIAAR